MGGVEAQRVGGFAGSFGGRAWGYHTTARLNEPK